MRKWLFEVRGYSDLDNRPYRSTIVDIHKNSSKAFGVTFRLQESSQLGRQINIQLPLPLYPQGLSIDLFCACGLKLEVGDKFNPKDAIGKDVMCRFKKTGDDTYEAVSFETIEQKEEYHDQ